jgi:hypothetical protein
MCSRSNIPTDTKLGRAQKAEDKGKIAQGVETKGIVLK